MMRAGLACLLMVLAMAATATRAQALDCKDLTFEGIRYTICEVDPAQDDLRLFLDDETGDAFGHFSALDQMLQDDGQKLQFAMNAGMYHEDRSPVGHFVEDGQEVMRVIPNAGPGNFGLLPNGILCISEARADVFETRAYLAKRPKCSFATQSGPMLVIDGALHPRFLPDSTSRYVRNGVGTSEDGKRAVFAISNSVVNFHSFARLFKDLLRLPNALFLDGNVSRLHAPMLGRSDPGRRMGPIVAVTAPLSN